MRKGERNGKAEEWGREKGKCTINGKGEGKDGN